ncbi:hypothetical protein KQX54_011080 [Cotesia glomerata]|uniref:Uncharacterized protein n=1 Tax=Cotesia glomerata TaxID=32391 RepID=A0AAV7IT14_COTGL|nr:hypothetical protein KQX54_011080 [Cotesia glomerata]
MLLRFLYGDITSKRDTQHPVEVDRSTVHTFHPQSSQTQAVQALCTNIDRNKALALVLAIYATILAVCTELAASGLNHSQIGVESPCLDCAELDPGGCMGARKTRDCSGMKGSDKEAWIENTGGNASVSVNIYIWMGIRGYYFGYGNPFLFRAILLRWFSSSIGKLVYTMLITTCHWLRNYVVCSGIPLDA